MDFSSSSVTCRPYEDLSSFGFVGNEFFGISSDNVVGLYDCEDSTPCEANCEGTKLPSCDGGVNGPGCCYPLFDHSIRRIGDDLSVFSKFGCRGFSSWVVPRGSNVGIRGVKLEWALPVNSSEDLCAANAHFVNATSVRHGIRCACDDSFVGDGFTKGNGCLKSGVKDGQEAYGKDGETTRHIKRTSIILAGVLALAFTTAAAGVVVALLCLLKWSGKRGVLMHRKNHFQRSSSSQEAGLARLFSLNELHQATNRFAETQKLVELSTGSVYSGTLDNGVSIAVQQINYKKDIRDIVQVLSQVEILSTMLHRHMAQILGCCVDSDHGPMVVYEFPKNGTLEEYLHQKTHRVNLDWSRRLRIAAQTASLLAFLHHEVSPPIFHHDLRSGCVFIDKNYSIKLACFMLLNSKNVRTNTGPSYYSTDVYDFGILLLEIISGSKYMSMDPTMLEKLRGGHVQDIVDPLLYYSKQPHYIRQQIDIAADIARRCMFGSCREIGMTDVARELVSISKESVDEVCRKGSGSEEMFSDFGLLQMISMSPDSIYVH